LVSTIRRSIVWRAADGDGMEYAALRHSPRELRLEGTVVRVVDGLPYRAVFTISGDRLARTRRVTVAVWHGLEERRLALLSDLAGSWRLDGSPADQIHGCIDVDLSISPITNTLPIRRLALAAGASAEVTAAWVRFPTLAVEPLRQRYTRLDERHYRYESDTGFSAELEVDEAGLVIDYPGGWTAVTVA
jgi:hypothetical protein